MSHDVVAVGRYEELRQRCAQQRQQLTQQFATIENQLQTADVLMKVLGQAVKYPELWLTGVAGLWAVKRSSLWSLIRRGWMVWLLAKRMMKWFRR